MGFVFGGILCHNMGCFLEHVFGAICPPAKCDCCCPNRVQDRQGPPASALRKVISAHPQRWERETGLVINLDVPQRRFSRQGLGREYRLTFWSKLLGIFLP